MSVGAAGAAPVRLDVALQGGGSHGAFTWGVLERLLDDDGIEFAALSGTSAGAMNAVAVACGLVEDGRRGAQRRLAMLWEEVGRLGDALAGPFGAWPDADAGGAGAGVGPTWAAWVALWTAAWSPWRQAFADAAGWWRRVLGETFSPYQTNPLGVNPLRGVLERSVDFDAVRRCRQARLLVAATDVGSGELRLFRGHEVDADVVLASACLPLLFRAVEIGERSYWDGGYAGNPSLLPLVADGDADDLMLVQINPLQRPGPPTQAAAIVERMNEIAFNASLLKELRLLGLLAHLARERGDMQARLDALATATATAGTPETAAAARDPLLDRAAALRLHRIDGGEPLAAFGSASKMRADSALLKRLHALGRRCADDWLAQHRDALGRHGTLALPDPRDDLSGARLARTLASAPR